MNQKGFSSILIILGVVVILGITGGMYYLGTKKSANTIPPSTPTTTFQSSPSATPFSASGASPTILPSSDASSLQKILSSKCQDYLYSGKEHIFGIKKDDLPVVIDTKKVNIITVNQTNIFACVQFDNKPNHSFVKIPISIYGYGFGEDYLSSPTIELLIYDSQSQEPSHGGYPSIGVYGKVIKDDGQEKLAINLSIGEVPIVYPNNTPVILTAEKKLRLASGEDIFVNLHALIIHGDDPRLVNIISKHSVSRGSGTDLDIEINDVEGGQNEIAQYFFGNLTNLKSPEKEKVEQIQKVLSAFTIK